MILSPAVLTPTPRAAEPAANQELAESGHPAASSSKSSDSSFWVTMGMIGLILAGMVLGACIATVWNTHMAPVNFWP
jgi:hypothetical protein